MLETVGVFFHCYRDREATRAVLRHFRRWYPVSTVHLISDGGLDFSADAWEFGCHYWHENNIGIQIQTGEETLHEWVRRVRRTCEQSDEDWILVLEDDVLVRGAFHVPEYAIAGSHRGQQLYTRPIGEYLFNRHPHLRNLGYGGGGGTLFDRRLAIQAIDAYFVGERFEDWRRMCGYVASDIWLTTIFMAIGQQYGPNPCLTEVGCDATWATNGRPLVHQPPREVLLKEPN